MSAQWPRQIAKLVQIVLGIGLLFFFLFTSLVFIFWKFVLNVQKQKGNQNLLQWFDKYLILCFLERIWSTVQFPTYKIICFIVFVHSSVCIFIAIYCTFFRRNKIKNALIQWWYTICFVIYVISFFCFFNVP